MKNIDKYTRGFFPVNGEYLDWAKKTYIENAPVWCSVDLRDGNQALITPMSLSEKVEFFKYLVSLGFKEIEIGFPAASETEYDFARKLIDDNLIPDDVSIQVLTQSREHIIKKTFDAIKGAKNAIVHLYNSTSKAQREQVFNKSKKEIMEIAVAGAKQLKRLAADADKNSIRFEYSPESFTGTEPEYALEVCNAVLDVFEPNKDNKIIINLPVTVSMSMPHVYASQIEFMSKNLKYRQDVILSIHPHNDRGTGVADAELALLAGGQRIEGTLFGNGERTGNVDVVTLALNMFSQGVDPKLDFSDISECVRIYEKYTDLSVNPRQPYAGALVFTAFSGSHQDAIAKGLKHREKTKAKIWDVPYLPIDPMDLGRNYDGDVIRINSQSGKGGIGYLMEQKFGFNMPPKMREDFSYKVKHISDAKHKELMPEEIKTIFDYEYVDKDKPVKLIDFTFGKKDKTVIYMDIEIDGVLKSVSGAGNGQFDAATDSIKQNLGIDFTLSVYTEHALSEGSSSLAAAYVGLEQNNAAVYAVGIDSDIMTASIKALIGAVNKLNK